MLPRDDATVRPLLSAGAGGKTSIPHAALRHSTERYHLWVLQPGRSRSKVELGGVQLQSAPVEQAT